MTNLKRIIDEKGVRQRWLAEQVGVTEVSMSRYVSGERIPKAPLAIRMADVLGVDVKDLYEWDDAHVIGKNEAQPETHEERTHAFDLISRQAAIDEIEERKNANGYRNVAVISELNRLEGYIMRLPSAQPVDKDIDVPSTDTISRQDAIRIVDGIDTWQAGWRGNAIESIKALPFAQPDIVACGDCKHWICHDRRCGFWNHGVKPLDWCCHAERRTDE